jgi:hypothetical protein
VSNCDNDIDVVTKTLDNDSMELINWFSLNLMKANPDKFQAIAIDTIGHCIVISIVVYCAIFYKKKYIVHKNVKEDRVSNRALWHTFEKLTPLTISTPHLHP